MGPSLDASFGPTEGAHWDRVFETQFDYVYRTLRRYGMSVSDAEDLAQDVFLTMWRRRATYDPERPLRPWIAGITFRVLQEGRRKGRREQPGGLLDMTDHAPRPDEHLAAAQARGLVLAALARVPEKQRTVLILHDLDGLAMKDIAEALAVPLFTLYSRLKSGRTSFAKQVRRVRSLAPFSAERLEMLLATERAAVAAPAAARRRALARLRALIAMPDLPPPAPTFARPWLGAVAAAALASAFFVWPRAGGSSHTSAAPQVAGGLVGYWRFDESPGSTWARDLSGQQNDCQLHRLDAVSAWVPGALAGALALDGRGWLECPHTEALAAISEELTISAWVTRGTLLRNYHAVVSRQKGVGRQDEFMFGFANGELLFASHSWRGKLTAALPPQTERWFHVAVTRQRNGTLILYAGGAELARGHTAAGAIGGDSPLLIGGASNGPSPTRTEARFDGGVDELRLYDRALPPREIALLARRQPL